MSVLQKLLLVKQQYNAMIKNRLMIKLQKSTNNFNHGNFCKRLPFLLFLSVPWTFIAVLTFLNILYEFGFTRC